MTDLYRAAEIAALPKDRGAICLVGDTGSADTLWQCGKPATTWGTGWKDEWTPHLAARHVVLIPERNEFGWAFARYCCFRLYGHVASLRWIVLPVDGDGGVRWWFEHGGDVEKLTRLVKATPVLCSGMEWNDREFDRVWAQNREATDWGEVA